MMKAKHTVSLFVVSLLLLQANAFGQADVAGDASSDPDLPFELPQGYLSSFTTDFAEAKQASLDLKSEVKLNQIIPGGVPLNTFIPFLGAEVVKVEVLVDGKMVEKYWQELTPEQWRRALPDQIISTTVYKADSSGSVSFLPYASGELKKGAYQLKYDNFRYKDFPCSKADPGAGRLYVGVGLRINANVNVKGRSVNIGFAPFALSASKQRVSGSIMTDIVGLANSKTLSQVVAETGGAVTYEGLIKASNAYAVAGQAIENMIELTNPRIVGYKDMRSEGSCLAALEQAK